MSLSSLQVLADNRDSLLLAEVAALLHDVGKFTDLHMEHHTANPSRQWSNDDAYKVVIDDPRSVIQLSGAAVNIQKPEIVNNVLNATSPKAADLLPASLKQHLQSLRINLLNQDYSLAELVMLGMPGFSTHQHRSKLLNGKDGWLPALLGLCHNVAHVDKEDPIGGGQTLPKVLVSNAFGYEQQTFVLGDPQKSLDARLKQIVFDFTNLSATRQQLLKTFEYGMGDTRRPTNEVSLADWSAIVAALFKAALAGTILTQARPDIRQWKSWKDKIIDHDFHWRLLRVNFDVLALYAKAVKIADLLAYQNAVSEACQKVKQLVEEEYPLGNEIYRDTTGIYFTFPDLDLPSELEREIRRLVEEVEPELAPRIAVVSGDGATAQEQLKGILSKARGKAKNDLAQPFDATNLTSYWQQLWQTVSREKKWEVCPLCRLRPKEEHAEICAHCEGRRKSRLETWKQEPFRTIWLGEVADHNDRVALLAGKFGLEDWLTGDLVQTMLVKADPASNTFTPKNPSPARLRRVWKTCQRFWGDAVLRDVLVKELGNRGQRKRIVQNQTDWQPGLYNGKVNGKPLDLFWQPEHGVFLTVSSLQAAGKFKEGDPVLLEHPETKQQSEFRIQAIQEVPDAFQRYSPYLTLPASPDQFLVFVPAAEALEIAKKIYSAYEEQFSKVRNRLPLFLGLIYFERKMPLMAVMDAARQMLEQPVPANSEPWTVHHVDGSGHVEFENGISWDVKTVMGDGKTEDWWYPYFQLDGAPAVHHTHRFQRNDNTWWVHVKNLQAGDKVQVTPSRFDFLWLDAAARRFALAYDKTGRRIDRPTRPFYLEDLDRLDQVWGVFSQLSPTQQKQVLQTIETTRERWFGRDEKRQSTSDETFRQFVKHTLANAQWPKEQTWKSLGIASPSDAARNDMQTQLIAAAVRGELADLEELHLEILKEKNEKE